MMLVLNNALFLLMTVFNRDKDYMNPLFIFLFLGLQGLINGIFLSYDLFNAYVLIEVSTVTVSILIMYKRDSRSMYDGMIYLLVNMFAMVFFLMGIGYLYKLFGVLDFASLKNAIANIENPKTLFLPYAFIITGVSLKAALMPLFSWLPKAHGTPSAPSIVSAVLSGIYVKTGVYLLIRVHELFSPLPMNEAFVIMGIVTAVLGFTFAIAQKDIKLILAYHTISQVGLILIGISSSSATQQAGGLYHLFNHGIFKALLFLIAGLLIETYHTRDITKMHALWERSKFLTVILLVAVFSITGAPFFSGGYSKYFIAYGENGLVMLLIMQFINLGTVLSFVKFFKLMPPLKHKSQAKLQSESLDAEHPGAEHSDVEHPVALKLSAGSRIALITLAGIAFLSGIAGDIMMPWLTGYESHLSVLKQIQKLPNYLILIAMSFGAYRLGFHDSLFIKAFRAFDLGFNAIAATVVIYFMGMLTMLYLIV
jgi:multicomponent Na+:H+ antiporter subunit D